MAYPLVVSLQQTLEPILQDSVPTKFQFSTNSELKLMYDHLHSMKSFFNKVITLEDSNNVEEVEREIKDVLQSTQDLIESHLSDLFHHGPESESSISGFYSELVKVNGELASLIKEVKAKEDYLTGSGSNKKKVGVVGDVAASSRIDFGRNKQVIVGLDAEKLLLKNRILEGSRSREVVSIVGMGGIGKTTLAKEVYLDPLVTEHFDVRLFVEIGVEYNLKEILLNLLGQVDFMERNEVLADELGEYLYKYLYGRRYLIVLDDIWDIEVWDQLRFYFPNNNNRSKIMLTTRLANAARYVCSTDKNVLEKRFLDDEESWELLQKMALSDLEVCPLELEKVGKTIAKKLRGLPLAIVTIGKLLSTSERRVESWTTVAENTHSPISEILKLSYTQLPQHLKACFLYLGLFPPNSTISTALLIKLWVAEGFIEEDGTRNKSLEEKAEEYLNALVDRNLVIIDELRSTGGIKACRVHGILQDLCVTEARLQKLYHIVNEGAPSFTQSTNDQRRLGIYTNVVLGSKELDSGIRSLVFICPQNQQPLEVNLEFKWLRVLHALSIRFWEFPDEVLKLVRLRYLAITYDGKLPPSISRLRNLEFLIIHRSRRIKSFVFLPLEIWELQKLRHLECMGFDLPDPSAAAIAYGNVVPLRKLATLLGVSARSCNKGVLARTPNVIKLDIWYQAKDHKVEVFKCFDAVYTYLRRLGSFNCAVMTRSLGSQHVKKFPYGLRKLTLTGCGFDWEDMLEKVGSLPLLEKLQFGIGEGFRRGEWKIAEGQFPRLRYLRISYCDLKRLTVEDESSIIFPSLRHLCLEGLEELEKIPPEIGEITTLQKISIERCGKSVVLSAKLIVEEQMDLYGEDLPFNVVVSLQWKNQALLSLAGPNFQVFV